MTTCTSLCGRAIAPARAVNLLCRRYASNGTAQAVSNGQARPSRAQDDHLSQRELFMDVLSANATKRDAKQYLARFKPDKQAAASPVPKLSKVQTERNARHLRDQERLERIGVNLGGLYAPSRAIANSPQFTREHLQQESNEARQESMHVALVCLRAPETLDDATVEGLATTLSQLVKLDTRIVLVLDLAQAQNDPGVSVKTQSAALAEQAERLSQAIQRHSPEASRFITGALEVEDSPRDRKDRARNVSVVTSKMIIHPLKRGVVPIIPSLAYTPSGQLINVDAGDVMVALTKELAGLRGNVGHSKELQDTYPTAVDRIIVLDEAGGIPSRARGDNAHVFINLEQEFQGIESELSEYAATYGSNGKARMYTQHQANLRMLNECLALLPSASSGLIISPQEAAVSSQAGDRQEPTIGAGTRRQKNTLIHNLLTNKPMVSSSLPAARMPSAGNTSPGEAGPVSAATATLVKRGMPVAIIPSADRTLGWQIPSTGHTPLSLADDRRVDFPRLLHLIENSFRRKLDVQHYLARIHGRIAGLIVAGEYEGAAILTWECPPGTSDPGRMVPYLDKFAVLQSSQGSSGVADILFQAMVRSCFPQGVCWRSRKDNPVNKWYFERAAGSWRIAGTDWTMFWTGEGVVDGEVRWRDYVEVCRQVVPSWADGKKPD